MTVLDFEPLTLAVPLYEDPVGVLRVGRSRVLLEIVLRAYQSGMTPELIVKSYDTLTLSDVYAVVSRYHASPAVFDEYLQLRDAAAIELRRKVEAVQGAQHGMKATLLARKAAKESERAQTAE